MNYLDSIDKVEILPGIAEAIRILNQNRFKVVVITNQSGVARGYFTEDKLNKIIGILTTSMDDYNDPAVVDKLFLLAMNTGGSDKIIVDICSVLISNPVIMRPIIEEAGLDDMDGGWLAKHLQNKFEIFRRFDERVLASAVSRSLSVASISFNAKDLVKLQRKGKVNNPDVSLNGGDGSGGEPVSSYPEIELGKAPDDVEVPVLSQEVRDRLQELVSNITEVSSDSISNDNLLKND